MVIKWKTGGEYYANGTWVQNYAQWESAMQPGKWTAVTCLAMWELIAKEASFFYVQNYLGDDAFSNGGRDEFEDGLFTTIQGSDAAEFTEAYKTEMVNYIRLEDRDDVWTSY